MHRESVVSVASFDSLPEEPPTVPAIMRNVNANANRRVKGRPSSIDPARRGNRRSVKPVDEAREVKRRKVIHEFYETEKAYVDGLELVYSVSYP